MKIHKVDPVFPEKDSVAMVMYKTMDLKTRNNLQSSLEDDKNFAKP